MEEAGQVIQLSFPFGWWDRFHVALLAIPTQSRVIQAVHAVWPVIGIVFLGFLFYSHQVSLGYLGIVLLCLLFSPLCLLAAVTAVHFTNPVAREPFTYTFDSAGITVRAPSYELKQPWAAISQVRLSGPFMLFRFPAGGAHFVPLKVIDASGSRDRLMALARDHGVRVSLP
jgi:hypothetical protein